MPTESSNELIRVYQKFLKMATFGDWLNLVEHMGLDVSDSRTLTYHASQLGLNVPNFEFAADPFYTSLKMLYSSKRFFEYAMQPAVIPAQNNEHYEDFFFGLSNKLYAFYQVIDTFLQVSKNLTRTRSVHEVHFKKKVSDFIHPFSQPIITQVLEFYKRDHTSQEINEIQLFLSNPTGSNHSGENFKNTEKEKIKKNRNPESLDEKNEIIQSLSTFAESLQQTPEEITTQIYLPDLMVLDIALRGVYSCSPSVWTSFIEGFIEYANYILQISARKSINGVSMKTILMQPLDLFIQNFITETIKQKNKEAEERFLYIFNSFVTGQIYIISSFIQQY